MSEVKRISEFFNNIVLKEHAWKLKLFKMWNEIIGELKNKVEIERIEGRLLILSATHSVWANELFLLSDLLKKKINTALGKEYIKAIRIKTKKKNSKNLISKKNYSQKDKHFIHINYFKTLCNLNKIEKKALDKIGDQELKDSLRDFYLSCKRGRNEKQSGKY
ncbi:DUF721 domain-containing protein [Candidatus Dependentiae bacterium]